MNVSRNTNWGLHKTLEHFLEKSERCSFFIPAFDFCHQIGGYKLYKMAPGKTAQSINVSLGLRMSAFNIPSIANICANDTIDLRELGSEKKVALFVVTPDTTTAYNFLAAVMFQQCFQILVDIADHRPDKRLPRHLRFLLDEFPNIGMIPDFQICIYTDALRDTLKPVLGNIPHALLTRDGPDR